MPFKNVWTIMSDESYGDGSFTQSPKLISTKACQQRIIDCFRREPAIHVERQPSHVCGVKTRELGICDT